MYPIKQSTAITVPFFVHDVNGDAVTGLTDGSFTKRISKNGAAFGAMTVTISEMENGWYSIPLSTAHSDTLGLLSITFTNAGSKQVNLQFRVHARVPDDHMHGQQIITMTPIIPESVDLADTANVRITLLLTNALGDLPSQAEIDPGTVSIHRKAIGGTTWSAIITDAACNESGGQIFVDEVFDSGTGYAEGDTVRFQFKNQSVTVGSETYELVQVNGFLAYTEIRQTMRGTDSALLASSDGSGLTAIPWNSNWDTEVESECNDALVALNLDHIFSAAIVGTDVTDNSFAAKIVSSSATADWDDFVNTTDSLQAIADSGGTSPWTAGDVNEARHRLGLSGTKADPGANSASLWTSSNSASIAGQAPDEALRRIGTIVSGTISGAATGTETFTDWASSANTVVVTVDASGNRTGVVFN